MGAQVIHEHDIALAQGRREQLFDLGDESGAIHHAVDHVRCCHAVDAQGCDERQCFPMPVRNLGDEPLADRRAAVEADHLRCHGRFVDEDEAFRLQFPLFGLQGDACGSDVRPILLGGVQGFF